MSKVIQDYTKKLGWIKDKKDDRDFKFKLKGKPEPIQSVYLNHDYRFPLAYDQSMLGSCTANAVAFLVQFNLLNNRTLEKHNPFTPSRLFTYYYSRELIGLIGEDSGAYLRDAIKTTVTNGAPSEDLWQYDISQFRTQPPEKAVEYGLKLQTTKYEKIDQTDKQLLVNALKQGLPICFGIYLFDSFFTPEVAGTGIVPYPNLRREDMLGGHAMVIVGYRQLDDSFIVRNSWGTNWGQKGYCRIPSKYITNPFLTSDFWVISEME